MSTVLGIRVDVTTVMEAAGRTMSWASLGESRYVCVATVQTVMEAHDSSSYSVVINQADMVTPDGMPLVWMLRLKGNAVQQRVYGPDLMLSVLRAAESAPVPVALYGSSAEVLDRLQDRLRVMFPRLAVSFALSPPFRDLTPEEDQQVVERISESGARIVFVGLGCPKQEKWMAAHRGRIPAVMIGVGAAFDFLSGAKPQAPAWMRGAGLEWLFRLAHEPRRLWRRYLWHNPRFTVLAIVDWLGVGRP